MRSLDDVVSKIASCVSTEQNIVNVAYIYDADTVLVSHTCQIPRKNINKIRLSFSLPHQVCQATTSKMDAFAFPLEVQDTWVCVFTNLDISLLCLCPEKCIRVRIIIRHQKKQGSVELSSISQQFLLGRNVTASGPELSTTVVQCTETPTRQSIPSPTVNEWMGMLDADDLFAQIVDNDLSSGKPETTAAQSPRPFHPPWKGIVSEAKALLPKTGCSIHDIRQAFDLLFAVFGSSDEYHDIRKGKLVTAKYILTMVSDEVRPYLARDMLEALESGSANAVQMWIDVTLKCLSTHDAPKFGH